MPSQLTLDVSGLLSVWTETLLYGLYCSLFFQSGYVTVSSRRYKSTANKVISIASLVLFCLITAHVAINLYRLLRGYVWLAADPGPASYFGDLGRWDNIAHDAINAIVTWIGDALMIYRCYIVWDKNPYIIILPLILIILSIVSNSIALHLFAEVGSGAAIFSDTLVHWMSTIYAVAFVQNFMTAGLIAYRLWRAERGANKNGLRSATTDEHAHRTLMPILWIIVESAAIYVIVVLVLIILYAIDSNAQYIVQEAFVPIVGIVFNLINLRITLRGNEVASSRSLITNSIRFKEQTDLSGTTATAMEECAISSKSSTVDIPAVRMRQSATCDEEKPCAIEMGKGSTVDISEIVRRSHEAV